MVHCTIGCMVLCTCLYAIHHRPNGVRELVAVHRQLCVRRWKTLLFGIPFVVFLLLFLIISNIFRSASFYFILDPILVAPYARSLCLVFYCFGVRSYFWKYLFFIFFGALGCAGQGENKSIIFLPMISSGGVNGTCPHRTHV